MYEYFRDFFVNVIFRSTRVFIGISIISGDLQMMRLLDKDMRAISWRYDTSSDQKFNILVQKRAMIINPLLS